jgi:hypothetical protein
MHTEAEHPSSTHAYWKRESNLDKAGALCSQKFTQEFNLKIYLFLRDVYKVNVVYFLEHNVFDFI